MSQNEAVQARLDGRNIPSTQWANEPNQGLLARFYENYRPAILGGGLLVVVAIIWELIVDLGYIEPLFLSPPSLIAFYYYKMFFVTGEIYPHLVVSAQEGVLGFAFAVAVGIPVGLAMGQSRTIRYLLEPAMMALYSTPMVALLPLFIIWMGIGLWSKVMLIFMGGVFAIAINTQAGVEATDPRLNEVARSFTASGRQILTKVILPSALPFIIAGIRLALGRILILIVVAELFGAMQGIGFMIMRAGNTFETAKLFVGASMLAVAGIALSQAMRVVERKVAPWMYARHEE